LKDWLFLFLGLTKTVVAASDTLIVIHAHFSVLPTLKQVLSNYGYVYAAYEAGIHYVTVRVPVLIARAGEEA
jgi:hypothetical protein